MMSKRKIIGPYEHDGFVILNHVGTLWGPTVFDSVDAAHAHIGRWKKDNPRIDLSKHRVVPGYSQTYALDEDIPSSKEQG
jgi:hypothetical protein